MSLVPVIRRLGVQEAHRNQMQISPQMLAPSFRSALFVGRLLKALAGLLGFPIAQPIPVRVRR